MYKYLKYCVIFVILVVGGVLLSAYQSAPSQQTIRKIALSPEQHAWIKKHPIINLGFDGDFPPYSFYENGQWHGYAVDVFKLIGQKTGLTFKPSVLQQWSWIYHAGKQRDLDVIATMVDKPERHQWFRFTSPYIFKSLVIVTRKEQSVEISRNNLAGKTVALVKDYQYVTRILNQFPSVTPYYVSNIQQALESVAAGKVDAAIGFLSAVHFYKEKLLLTNIEVASFFDRQSANESIAIRSDWPMLQQILQQA